MTATIDTVRLGRDRIGDFSDRSLGNFILAVASSDDAYADGADGNDASNCDGNTKGSALLGASRAARRIAARLLAAR
jgi:hypothetical protein